MGAEWVTTGKSNRSVRERGHMGVGVGGGASRRSHRYHHPNANLPPEGTKRDESQKERKVGEPYHKIRTPRVT